jgi:hypothetical protein
MRHSQIARVSAQKMLAIVALAFVGACADSVSAPMRAVTAKAPAAFSTVVGVTSFVYTPEEGVTQRFGDHLISIPAGAICDPATSGYGADFWDLPCSPLATPLTITATSFVDDYGRPYVDFEPAIRFSPSTEVRLYLRDGRRPKGYVLSFAYCTPGGTCVDESLQDSSLVTSRVGKIFSRRLKHFSGYYITASDECTGSVEMTDDGSLYCNTDAGLMRSGYILASGLGSTSSNGSFGRRKKTPEK